MLEDYRLKAFRMPLSTIVEVSRGKEVVYTSVSAGKTSIKEVSGFKDWDIKIKGLFLDEKGHPQDADSIVAQKRRLLEFESVCGSIEVYDGWLFDLCGIYRIFIEQLEISPVKGAGKISGFSMTCKSDEPYEIEIKNQ
ncbi:hypothetical protein ElyMa_002565200 [Elysia marginata]|uniref:DUF6046 domain-containing protein n=1 Tax=Elysia marginata TaxID=1093978 RepID=A0AAV4H0Q8_9GAST|nr:hypothetical protein ElyMa_002565200 [Elysia marginata]